MIETILHALLSNALLACFLAVVVSGVTRLWKNHFAARALWLVVLLKLLTPPMVHVPLPFPYAAAPEMEENDKSTEVMESIASAKGDPYSDEPVFPEGGLAGQPSPDPSPNTVAVGEPSHGRRLPLGGLAVAVWISGSLIWCLAAVSRSLIFHRLLKRHATTYSHVQQIAAEVCRRIGQKRCPKILVTPARISPFVWSAWRPAVIILPRDLVGGLDSQQLKMLLAHELSHLLRGGPWVRRLEMLALAIYWWNPIAWWAVSQLRDAEEKCCDAAVMESFPGKTREYVELLLKAAEFALTHRGAPGAAISFGKGKQLKRRVSMIVNLTLSPRLAFSARFLLLLLALAVLPLAVRGRAAEDFSRPSSAVVAEDPPADQGQKAKPSSKVNDATKQKPSTPPGEVDRLIAEYETVVREASKASRKAKTRKESNAAWRRVPKRDEYGRRFLEFAEQNPDDSTSTRALAWVVHHSSSQQQVKTALTTLLEKHLKSESLDAVFPRPRRASGQPSTRLHQQLARAALEKSPHRKVKRGACLSLAGMLATDALRARRIQDPRGVYARGAARSPRGAEWLERLRQADPDKLSDESKKLYQRAFDEFKDAETLVSILSGRVMSIDVWDKAFQTLLEEHDGNKEFVKLVKRQGGIAISPLHHRLILAKSRNRELQCAASYQLARRLQRDAATARILRETPDNQLDQQYTRQVPAEYIDRLRKVNPGEALAEAVALLTRIVNEFGDVEAEVYDSTSPDQSRSVGRYRQYAEEDLYALRQIAVSRVAPNIEGEDILGGEVQNEWLPRQSRSAGLRQHLS